MKNNKCPVCYSDMRYVQQDMRDIRPSQYECIECFATFTYEYLKGFWAAMRRQS